MFQITFFAYELSLMFNSNARGLIDLNFLFPVMQRYAKPKREERKN